MDNCPDKPEPPFACCARRVILFGAALLGASGTSWAQERPVEPTASNWSVGAFASTESSPYRGADDKRRLLPLVAFENAYVRWAGPMLDIKLPSTGPVSYALRARYADAGYEASDSASLAGMAERKSSVWVGAKAEWQHDFGQLSAEWLADAANHSGGQQIKLTAEKPVRFGRMGLVPRVALIWQDSDQVDYYFGVRSSEATAARVAYTGQSTVSTELGLRGFYGLDRQQSLFMDLHTTALGTAIKNSPLVDRSWVSGLRLGYAYRF